MYNLVMMVIIKRNKRCCYARRGCLIKSKQLFWHYAPINRNIDRQWTLQKNKQTKKRNLNEYSSIFNFKICNACGGQCSLKLLASSREGKTRGNLKPQIKMNIFKKCLSNLQSSASAECSDISRNSFSDFAQLPLSSQKASAEVKQSLVQSPVRSCFIAAIIQAVKNL